MLTDAELLAIEVDTLWVRDDRGRLLRAGGSNGAPAPYLVIAVCPEGRLTAVGGKVPEALATELLGFADAPGPPPLPSEPPPGLDAWAARLAAAVGPVEVTSGPSYVAEAGTLAAPPAALIQSDGTAPFGRPLEPPPDAGWEPAEWRMLLAGRLGPWAMSMASEHIAAICFSSRLTDVAAEAGLRTEPEFRRQGHGAAATAAWARLVIETDRIAFYSTSADNLASQRVAASLGLRSIGWRWQLGRPSSG